MLRKIRCDFCNGTGFLKRSDLPSIVCFNCINGYVEKEDNQMNIEKENKNGSNKSILDI